MRIITKRKIKVRVTVKRGDGSVSCSGWEYQTQQGYKNANVKIQNLDRKNETSTTNPAKINNLLKADHQPSSKDSADTDNIENIYTERSKIFQDDDQNEKSDDDEFEFFEQMFEEEENESDEKNIYTSNIEIGKEQLNSSFLKGENDLTKSVANLYEVGFKHENLFPSFKFCRSKTLPLPSKKPKELQTKQFSFSTSNLNGNSTFVFKELLQPSEDILDDQHSYRCVAINLSPWGPSGLGNSNLSGVTSVQFENKNFKDESKNTKQDGKCTKVKISHQLQQRNQNKNNISSKPYKYRKQYPRFERQINISMKNPDQQILKTFDQHLIADGFSDASQEINFDTILKKADEKHLKMKDAADTKNERTEENNSDDSDFITLKDDESLSYADTDDKIKEVDSNFIISNNEFQKGNQVEFYNPGNSSECFPSSELSIKINKSIEEAQFLLRDLGEVKRLLQKLNERSCVQDYIISNPICEQSVSTANSVSTLYEDKDVHLFQEIVSEIHKDEPYIITYSQNPVNNNDKKVATSASSFSETDTEVRRRSTKAVEDNAKILCNPSQKYRTFLSSYEMSVPKRLDVIKSHYGTFPKYDTRRNSEEACQSISKLSTSLEEMADMISNNMQPFGATSLDTFQIEFFCSGSKCFTSEAEINIEHIIGKYSN